MIRADDQSSGVKCFKALYGCWGRWNFGIFRLQDKFGYEGIEALRILQVEPVIALLKDDLHAATNVMTGGITR